MLILLAAAYFVFMATEAMFVDTSSCISEIIEVHPDVLVDLLVMLAMTKHRGARSPRHRW